MQANPDRKQQFVTAVVAGIHAHQARLARESGKGDPACFAFPGTETDATASAAAFTSLTHLPSDVVMAWVQNRPAPGVDACMATLGAHPFTPAAALPYAVISRWLQRHAPHATASDIAAVASLYQIVLQVELDADEVQGLFRLYIGMQLPTSLAMLGFLADRKEFLAMAADVAPACCDCPFDVSVAAWHLASRKITNWSEKLRGTITATTYARELLERPEIRACTAALRALPPQRVCVLGHSFTMSMHWASHGSFTDIAGHVVRQVNPGIEWLHVGRGGLTPTLARRLLLEQVLKLHPDLTILVTISRNAEDRANLHHCIERLREAGSRVIVFDCVMVYREIYETEKLAVPVAREAGATVLEVFDLLDKHPQRADFPALDGVHTAPPYHLFMATELVRFLAGQRGARAG